MSQPYPPASTPAPGVHQAAQKKATTPPPEIFEALVEELFGAVAIALAGISILGIHPLEFLRSWGEALENQAAAALSGSQAAQSSANQAQSTANGAQADLGHLINALVNGFNLSSIENAVVSDVEGVAETIAKDLEAAKQVAGAAWTALEHLGAQVGTAVNSGAQTAWKDLESLAAAVGADIGQVIANASAELGVLRDVLTNAFGGSGSGNTNAAMSQQAISLAETAQNAEYAAIQNAFQIAQLQQTNTSAAGAVANVITTGADGDPLSSADWSASGPVTGDLCVRVGSNNSPSVGIAAGLPAGTYWAESAHSYLTTNQTFECVLGSGGTVGNGGVWSGTPAATRLLFHCNAAGTQGGYLAIRYNGIELGYFTLASGIYTWNPLGTVSVTLAPGSRVEVHNVGNVYTILVNALARPPITDANNHIPLDTSHLNAFVVMERGNATWDAGAPWATHGSADSFQLPGVLISDYIPAPLVGDGARVVRQSTTAVTVPKGTITGLFDAEDVVTNGAAWNGNALTIDQEDWWTFDIRLQAASQLNRSTTYYLLGIAINGVTKAWGEPTTNPVESVAVTGGGNQTTITDANIDAVFASLKVYCHVNDVVAPVLVQAPASLSVVGDAGGCGTYFTAIRGSK